MSENLNLISLFPAKHFESLIANAKSMDGFKADAADLPAYAAELLKCFPQGSGEKFHRDAAESIFVARQLEFIRQGVIDASFPPLKASGFLPFDTTPDEGAENYTVTYSDQAGEVRVSKDMRGIIPQVDVSVGQKTFPIFMLLQAYGYTLSEARAALRERKPLPVDRAMRCREQIQRKMDSIALLGEPTAGLKGLFNLSGTDTFTTPAGAKGSKSWLQKSPEEILSDWNASVTQVVVNTKESETPNVTVMATSNFEYVNTKRVGDGTSDTISTFFKRNNPHIKRVESSHKLESNSGWTGKRMVHFESNILKIAMIVPTAFEQLSPDVTSTETNTVCLARTAGVIAHRPKSVIYVDET